MACEPDDDPKDDGTAQCEGCGACEPSDELNDGYCDECQEDERLETEHHRLESHSSRFI